MQDRLLFFGEKVEEERTGELHQYGRSERVLAVETILPENAPAEYREPTRLFNGVTELAQDYTLDTRFEMEQWAGEFFTKVAA